MVEKISEDETISFPTLHPLCEMVVCFRTILRIKARREVAHKRQVKKKQFSMRSRRISHHKSSQEEVEVSIFLALRNSPSKKKVANPQKMGEFSIQKFKCTRSLKLVRAWIFPALLRFHFSL